MNGQILLKVHSHKCMEGFSTNFVGVKTSYDLVNKWNELTAVQTPVEKVDTVPSHSPGHVAPDKRPSGAAIASAGVLHYDQPSPARKTKLIKMRDPIDESIERAKNVHLSA